MAKDIKCPNCGEPMGYAKEIAACYLSEESEIECGECGEFFEVIEMGSQTGIPSKLMSIEPGLDIEEEEEEEED